MYMKISWGAQLMAGVTLFVISFALETLVLRAYFDELSLAIGLAAALEVSKALSIVLYRSMKEYRDSTYPRSVTGLTLLFRLALFTLSLACSLMYLAEQLDRPNLQGALMGSLLAHGFPGEMAIVSDDAGQFERWRSFRGSGGGICRRQLTSRPLNLGPRSKKSAMRY